MTSWTWSDNGSDHGLDLDRARRVIAHWSRPHGPNGRFGEVGAEQTVDAFLKYGPDVRDVPLDVIDGVLDALSTPQSRYRPSWRHPSEELRNTLTFHARIKAGDLDAPGWASDMRIDVDARDTDGRSALWWAAVFGHVDLVHQLLARNADANAPDRFGTTPLLHAMRHDDPQGVTIARALLQRDADPNLAEAKSGDAPLHRAPTPAVATLLLQHGADRAQGDAHGNVPAIRALRAGRDDVVRALSEQ
jgi:ankyrin repeat protein